MQDFFFFLLAFCGEMHDKIRLLSECRSVSNANSRLRPATNLPLSKTSTSFLLAKISNCHSEMITTQNRFFFCGKVRLALGGAPKFCVTCYPLSLPGTVPVLHRLSRPFIPSFVHYLKQCRLNNCDSPLMQSRQLLASFTHHNVTT
jgi:hypothetical protein